MKFSSDKLSALSVDEIAQLCTYCYENAVGLLEDAKLLFLNDRFPRTAAISILALEELAKATLIAEAYVSNREES